MPPDDLAAAVRLFVLARDCVKTPPLFPGYSAKDLEAWAAKPDALDGELAEYSQAAGLPDTVATDRKILLKQLRQLLREAGPVPAEILVPLLIDGAQGIRWPKGIKWAPGLGVGSHLAAAAAAMAPRSGIDVADLLKRHKAAAARLRKDSLSPAMQAGVGAAMAVAAAASGGAANAIGTMVGTHILGLSGAAATSAGLAALGGGSLASGGAGMAGGLVVASLVFATVKGAGHKVMLGVAVAQESPHLFIHELAKVDVAWQLGLLRRRDLLEDLRHLQVQLVDQLKSIPEREGRASRVADKAAQAGRMALKAMRPGLVGQLKPAVGLLSQSKDLWDELPTKDERNLAASVRAVEFEIRHLTAPKWKRRAAAVPRFVGMPSLSRLLDRID